MSSYTINNSAPSVSNLSVTIIATAMFLNCQAQPVLRPVQANLKPTSYSTSSTSSTFDQQTNFLTGEIGHYSDPLIETVSNVYAYLLTNQEKLEPEFERILHDNLWDLYES